MKAIHETRYKKLIRTLKGARVAAGLNQEDVAKKMGWSTASIVSKIESSERRIDIMEFFELSVLYEAPISDFLRKDYKVLLE